MTEIYSSQIRKSIQEQADDLDKEDASVVMQVQYEFNFIPSTVSRTRFSKRMGWLQLAAGGRAKVTDATHV